jgi:hypothetical protein
VRKAVVDQTFLRDALRLGLSMRILLSNLRLGAGDATVLDALAKAR